MSEYEDYAMIAYPVTWPDAWAPDVENLHSTVLYLGDVSQAAYGPEDIIQALEGVSLNFYLWADVIAGSWFGPDSDIPVLEIDHMRLIELYDQITVRLKAIGVYSASEYGYRPHVTVEPITLEDALPKKLLLGPMELTWRDTVYPLDSPKYHR